MSDGSPRYHLITTRDQSHSLFIPELNEHYHSIHGALTEARHVFIKNGLDAYHLEHGFNEYRVLELGFGTGLNALLAMGWAEEHKTRITYTTLEKYPLPIELVSELNYASMMEGNLSGDWKHWFNQIHQADWNKSESINPWFVLEKYKLDALEFTKLKQCVAAVDVIFFDAFAPNKQSELWDIAVFKTFYELCKPGSFLVTYCAQGQLRRNLKEAGFVSIRLEGPPGKREMTRGLRP
jgi:tRNA U34 5-methylaminomethyl-2-thiouridine-forming methyltransferase MnmC